MSRRKLAGQQHNSILMSNYMYCISGFMAIATPKSDGGYGYDFISTPPDRFICEVCHLPSRDPYLSVCCGHIFCKSCLDNVKKSLTTSDVCPVCRDEEFVTFPQKEANREINSLHIYCTYKEKGCEWQGELNDINNHLGNSDGCQFEEVKCSNECGEMIQRQYLTSHVETECPRRKVSCQYCHDAGEHQFIEGQHKEECPKLPLPCPNKCEVGSVPREDMEVHRKECPLEVIQCEYYSLGCKRVKLVHKDLEEHYNENMKEHLMMTKNKLADTTVQLDAAMKKINSLTAVVNRFSAQLYPLQLHAIVTNQCPATIKMTKYEDDKANNTHWNSNPFYTHNKGYKMCLRVDANGVGSGRDTHLSVFLYLTKGPHDNKLTWPLRGKFEIKLLNQISDSKHYSRTLTYNDSTPNVSTSRVTGDDGHNQGWGYLQYISNEDLNKISPTRQFLKDGCLFFQVTKL